MEPELSIPPYIYQEYADLVLFAVFTNYSDKDNDLAEAFIKPNHREDAENLADKLKNKELSHEIYSAAKDTLMPFNALLSKIKEELKNNNCPICFSKYEELTVSFSFCCKTVSCSYCLQKNNDKCIICKKSLYAYTILFELDSNQNLICLNAFPNSSNAAFKESNNSIKRENRLNLLFFNKLIEKLLSIPKPKDIPIKTFLTYEKIKNSIFVGETKGEYSLITGFSSSIRLTDKNIISIACLQQICLVLERNRLRIMYSFGKLEEIEIKGETTKIKVVENRAFLAINGFIYEFVEGKVVKINETQFEIKNDCDWSVGESFFVARKNQNLVCFFESGKEEVLKEKFDSFCSVSQDILICYNRDIIEYSIGEQGKAFSKRPLGKSKENITKIVYGDNKMFYFQEGTACFGFSLEKGFQFTKNNILDFWVKNSILCYKDAECNLNIQKEGFSPITVRKVENFIDFTNPTGENCIERELSNPSSRSIPLHNISNDSEEEIVYVSESDSEEPFYIFN